MSDSPPPKPELGSPDHDAAMLQKYEAANPPPTPPQDAPAPPAELIDGKFKTNEDLLKAYKELEAKLSGKPPAEPPATPPVADAAATPPANPDAPIDYSALTQEINSNGKLSDESRAKLTKMGLPDAMIDAHVSAITAQAEAAMGVLETAAGGADALEQIRSWGTQNLSDSEKSFIQAQLSAGGEMAKQAINALKNRYETANGRDPQLLSGQGGTANGNGFRSITEMTTAMKDPRYATDPAYRRDVENRVATAAF
jgi:hypothetical protein